MGYKLSPLRGYGRKRKGPLELLHPRLGHRPEEQLIRFHHGWGTGIRNEFGLWKGNKELLADCHAEHPDDASMVIIQAVWERLQKASK